MSTLTKVYHRVNGRGSSGLVDNGPFWGFSVFALFLAKVADESLGIWTTFQVLTRHLASGQQHELLA